MLYKDCSCKKIFSRSEKRSGYKLFNNGNYYICEVKIDSGLISEGRKCDWLYEVYKPCDRRVANSMVHCINDDSCKNLKKSDDRQGVLKEIIFIELKGEKVKEAVDQIEQTYKFLKKNHPHLAAKNRRAYIVSTCCPSKSSELDKMKRELKTKTGIILDRLKTIAEIKVA